MKFRKFSFVIVLSLVYFLPACNPADISRQWPQFHGYMGKGIFDQTDVPATWNLQTAENVLWKAGKIIWDRIADEGVPKERRHTKSTYANPTPAITDGMIIFRTQHSMIAIGKK
ncbi:MAG: hypothetical protein WC865_08185 [Bacteroidales bacterium]